MPGLDMNAHSSRAIRLAAEASEKCIHFLQELMALPSPPGSERFACERVVHEMEELGFDEIRVDRMGNVLGRVGSGQRRIAFDAHVDTVGISRPASWSFDPFRGKLLDGVLYGRGASDQKGGVATIIHGAALAARLGLPEDLEIWVSATVNGEDCVGLSWRHILQEEGLQPEAVLIAMPSHLGLCRGQRGRLELSLSTEGIASHGSHPQQGRNAITAMAPIVQAISELHEDLDLEHPMLGKGSIAVTGISSESPALTAIPDGCTIHLDRRLTIGETVDEALAQLEAIEEVHNAGATVNISEYHGKSWKGLKTDTRKIFPAWETPEDTSVYKAAFRAAELVLGRAPRLHRSAFSSNACTTAGIHKIPTIGFGPASEQYSHSTQDQIPLSQLPPAIAFYALFPALYLLQSPAGMKKHHAESRTDNENR